MSGSLPGTYAMLNELAPEISPAWEYDTITFSLGATFDQSGVWVAKHPFKPEQAPLPIKDVLNDIGKEGWDLSHQIGSNTLIYIIKRAIPLSKRTFFTKEQQ